MSTRCRWLALAVLMCLLASTIWLLVESNSDPAHRATPRPGTTEADDGLNSDDGDDVLILCESYWVAREGMSLSCKLGSVMVLH